MYKGIFVLLGLNSKSAVLSVLSRTQTRDRTTTQVGLLGKRVLTPVTCEACGLTIMGIDAVRAPVQFPGGPVTFVYLSPLGPFVDDFRGLTVPSLTASMVPSLRYDVTRLFKFVVAEDKMIPCAGPRNSKDFDRTFLEVLHIFIG